LQGEHLAPGLGANGDAVGDRMTEQLNCILSVTASRKL
jgi:hypothetical protein